jgi:hypothetical protein
MDLRRVLRVLRRGADIDHSIHEPPLPPPRKERRTLPSVKWRDHSKSAAAHWLLPSIVLSALLATPAASGAEHQYSAKQICARHVCRTLAANRNVRVFRATDRHGYDIVYGEWLPTRQVRLITLPRSEPITAMALVGSRFAYAERYGAGRAVLVYLQDLRPRGPGAGWIAADDLERNSHGVTKLALSRSGTIAWVVEGRFMDPADIKEGPHPESRAIFVVPELSDEPVFLAYGTDIATQSLTTAHGQVHWIQSGVRRSYVPPQASRRTAM